MKNIFEKTRPYIDAEIPAAVRRVADNPAFSQIIAYLFPSVDFEDYKKQFLQIQTVEQFQKQVMQKAIHSIVNMTSDGLSTQGFEKLSNNKKGMFIGNHRDILLDAAILQIMLFQFDLDTSEITFGSNLMKGEIVIDIGKMNKMFRIVRGGNIRDFYKNSIEVSSYMRYAITQKKQSVWIAQRNGRTKDGNDKTEMAVLKMFAISSEKPFVDNLAELNITPLVISYEYEPCDFLKTQELFVTKYQKYEKAPGEDLNSILQGIRQPKGHIHLVAADSITNEELLFCDQLGKNNKYQKLAQIIDNRVYANYQLWKTNYIAHDLWAKSYKYHDFYSESEKSAFIEYMDNGLHSLIGDYDELRDIFLLIYAQPVINKENIYL